jgi:hypothetical protein
MTLDWPISILVVVNLLALGVLFRRTNPKRGRPKKKFYWDLVRGPAITPTHSRPEPINELRWGLSEADRQFFDDFYDFGDVVNWWFAEDYNQSRWRLQELKDTELKIGNYDSPSYGRRYEVFCGPTKLGTLEIRAAYKYNVSETNVNASIELQWVRLLGFDTLAEFLGGVATHIDSSEESGKRIHAEITRSLWNSLDITPDDYDGLLDWGELEITLTGNAQFYFDRKNSKSFQSAKSTLVVSKLDRL